MVQEKFKNEYRALSKSDKFSISISAVEVPFGVLIVDDSEAIVPFGSVDGQLRAIIRNDSNPALEWANDIRSAIESGSTPETARESIQF